MSAPFRVLVLCTGNSARSIMAEALFNARGEGFRACSAGSDPVGRVNPLALEVLLEQGFEVRDLRSKSWNEFVGGTPFDFVITVCDHAAAQLCPVFPGAPLSIHWSLADPALEGIDDAARRRRFAECFEQLRERVCALAALPLARMSKVQVAAAMRALAPQGGG